jgi:uncharacterized protein
MSTLWKSVAVLDSSHYSMVLNQPFEATDEDMHDLAELERIRILVRKDIDEFSLARTTIESWKRPPMLSVTYCLTYACNMACSYCIQKRDDSPANPVCAARSPDDVAAFILQGLSFYGLDAVEVVLFGGEPTLEYDRMLEFMVCLNALARKQTLSAPTYHLVTNGTLLTTTGIRLLAGLGLRKIQLTVDGLPSMHNMRRRVSSGTGTWGKLWENILSATQEGITTSVNMVVDAENMSHIRPTVDVMETLSERYPYLKTHSKVVFSLLIPTRATQTRCASLCYGREKELLLAILEGYKYARDLGWKTTNWFFCGTSARESYHAFIVGPDGRLFKCYGTIGDAQHAIGSIDDPFPSIDRASREVASLDLWDEDCSLCPILPFCRGGCQAISAISHGGEFGHKLCEKEIWLPVMSKALEYEFC